MPSPIPLLNNVATSALSYTAPVFNSFKPFLIIIIGFFAGYFILYTIIEYFVAMKERKTEELQGEREFVINIAKKIYEPLYTKEITDFIKKKQEEFEAGQLSPSALVDETQSFLLKKQAFYSLIENSISKAGKKKRTGLIGKIFKA
jgi:hypothetical protein